jgi:hypothetical protein
MSKILKGIETHFGYGECFHPRDLSKILNINQKVLSMVLKKYHNSYILGFLPTSGIFYLNTVDEVLKLRLKSNEMIDKYDLKQPKFKIK